MSQRPRDLAPYASMLHFFGSKVPRVLASPVDLAELVNAISPNVASATSRSTPTSWGSSNAGHRWSQPVHWDVFHAVPGARSDAGLLFYHAPCAGKNPRHRLNVGGSDRSTALPMRPASTCR